MWSLNVIFSAKILPTSSAVFCTLGNMKCSSAYCKVLCYEDCREGGAVRFQIYTICTKAVRKMYIYVYVCVRACVCVRARARINLRKHNMTPISFI
jgi:hypothetical protein